jgi:hypothetical protein
VARSRTISTTRVGLGMVLMQSGESARAINPTNDRLMVLTVDDRRPGGVVGHR